MQLKEDATEPLTNVAMEEYEEFDNAITRIMLIAEKKCRKYVWREFHSHLNCNDTLIALTTGAY